MDSLLRKDRGGVSDKPKEIVKPLKPKKRVWKKVFWLVVLIVAVVTVANLWVSGSIPFLKARGGYNAVFLTNGQVYFGKLAGLKTTFPTLTDVYYLRVTQALQPAPNQQTQPNINLVKLGNELHKPTDEMKINRDHILFVETLESDSAVIGAIQEFKAGQ